MFAFVGIILIVIEIILLRVGMALTGDAAQASTQLQKKRAPPQRRNSDGKFNGYPVSYHGASNETHTNFFTLLHCVGENYQKENWMHRSCHFRFLCFDIQTKEFSIYQRPEDVNIRKWSDQRPFMDLSQSLIREESSSVSLGGINLHWRGDNDDGLSRLKWFPNIMEKPPSSFYALSEDVVLVPFHSLAGWNPGNLVWDDFLPIYSLMAMFQLEEEKAPLLLRYVLSGNNGLEDSCDTSDETYKECLQMHRKFWPIMTRRNESVLTTQLDARLDLPQNQSPRSNLVCAKEGLAGIGPLTDHGIPHKMHGLAKEKYLTTHNHGRGGLFWKFRNYCLNNLGIEDPPRLVAPYQIIFSLQSSSGPEKNIDFSLLESVLRKKLDPNEALVQSYVLKDLTLQKQVKLATRASIFIAECGDDDAVAATFLPRGATLILFCDEDDEDKLLAKQKPPSDRRLGWDLFNNLAYLNVYWFPDGTLRNRDDMMEPVVQVVNGDLSRRKSSNAWTD